MSIEKELVEASGFSPRKNYQRQDYLAALARAVNEIEEDKFDAMSTDAQDWFNDAVRALNKKTTLPEFADATTEAEVAEVEDGAGSAEEAADTEPEDSDDEDEPEAKQPP